MLRDGSQVTSTFKPIESLRFLYGEPKTFYNSYQQLLDTNFPGALSHIHRLDHLVSPFIIEIPDSILHQAQSIIQTIYQIACHPTPKVKEQLKKFCPPQVKNSSVLMAYDFHLVDHQLKLIEINTNASGFILSDLSQRVHGFPSLIPSLRHSFFEEMQSKVKNISIVDKSPREQKMYGEFLMYQQLLQSWGFSCTIDDTRDFRWEDGHLLCKDRRIDFVYNRCCDFLLEEESSKTLSLAYKSGTVTFSPQPRDYILLADKQRLVDWLTPCFQEQLKPHQKKILQKGLIHSQEAKSFKSEDLWRLRKKLFFKPKNSYGGRSTYRGKSISKKNFNRVIKENFLVQDFIPPGTIYNNKSWKYDLRFYVFKDQIQLSITRIYRGQVTNFNELHGGYTIVRFVSSRRGRRVPFSHRTVRTGT